jgi:DNA polymerase III subunit delta
VAKGGPTYADLRAALKKRSFLPVYLLHGEEDFLLESALTAVLDAVLPEELRSLNLDVLDCGDVAGRDIVARAASFPMMGDTRVVIAKNIERMVVQDLEQLTGYVESPSESTVLILAGKKADLRRKPFSTLHARGAAFEFAHVRDSSMASWITDRVDTYGATIDDDAADLLSVHVGVSLREVDSEITKLLTYLGDRKHITTADVADVVGFSREFTIFQLQECIGKGDIRRAMVILDHMLDDGQALPYFIVMLTGYFSTLWRLHHLVACREKRDPSEYPKAWNWKKDEFLAALRLFPPRSIERAFKIMAETEFASRQTGGADQRDLLHGMLVRIMEGVPALA